MNRTNAKNPTGCSVCNGKTVIPGINDVATTHPDVAALMVDQSLCTQLTGSSNKRVELWCGNPTHDHWVAPLSNVARQGTRCPQCSGRRPIVGQNDLATTHPTLAMQLVDQSLAITLKAGSNPLYAECKRGVVTIRYHPSCVRSDVNHSAVLTPST